MRKLAQWEGWEWLKLALKIIGMAGAVFVYGEHQLNAVNAHAENLIRDERTERREDYKNLDGKMTQIQQMLMRWEREDKSGD